MERAGAVTPTHQWTCSVILTLSQPLSAWLPKTRWLGRALFHSTGHGKLRFLERGGLNEVLVLRLPCVLDTAQALTQRKHGGDPLGACCVLVPSREAADWRDDVKSRSAEVIRAGQERRQRRWDERARRKQTNPNARRPTLGDTPRSRDGRGAKIPTSVPCRAETTRGMMSAFGFFSGQVSDAEAHCKLGTTLSEARTSDGSPTRTGSVLDRHHHLADLLIWLLVREEQGRRATPSTGTAEPHFATEDVSKAPTARCLAFAHEQAVLSLAPRFTPLPTWPPPPPRRPAR